MANRTSHNTQIGTWRYRIASWLALSALALGALSYLNRPTTNLFSAEGNADLHQMVWLAVAAVVCLFVSGCLAVSGFGARHRQNSEVKQRHLTRV